MYSKNKGGGQTSVSSDAQAREKLALYVYEYLIHIGAQKAAQTFLSEIRWEKNITLGEPPGFLHFWWCVFWDLYCAAPERCDTTEQSGKPKPFHDYTPFVNSGYPANPPPPGPAGPNPPMQGVGPSTEAIPCNGPGSGPGPAGFYPNKSQMRPTQPAQPPMQQTQPSHQQMISSPYLGPRYPTGPRPGPRLGMGTEYSGHPGHPAMMANGADPTSRQIPGGMGQMNHRMNAPMGPRGPPVGPGVPFIGMVPPGGGRPQWQPNSSSPMNNGYPVPSPGNYAGAGHSGPGTPTMPSPRESGSNQGVENIYGIVKSEGTRGNGGSGEYGSNQTADNLYGIVKTEPTRGSGGPGEYGSNHGGEKLYNMAKTEQTRGNSAPGEYVMSGRTSCDGSGQIRGIPQNPIGSVLNNDSLANSPAGGPVTPRNVGNGNINDFGLPAFEGQGENGQMESAAILKIKESMQEEAKRFEKGSEQSDFFMR